MTTSHGFIDVSRRCLAVVVALALLLLSGCVTSEGGAVGELKRATEHAQYAVATVEDSFGQLRRGRTLSTVAETTTQDMLSELEKAQKQVFELKVDTAAEDRQRTAVTTWPPAWVPVSRGNSRACVLRAWATTAAEHR